MAVTNVVTVSLGGGLSMQCGSFTHTVGGAAETQAVAAGKVYLVQVNPQVSSSARIEAEPSYSIAVSGAISTITIYHNAGVTDGTYCIIFGN